MKRILKRKEAAKLAGVSERTILRAIHSRRLEAVKNGEGVTSSYLIDRSDLESYIQKRGWK